MRPSGRAGWGAAVLFLLALPVFAGCSTAPAPRAEPSVSAIPSQAPTAPTAPPVPTVPTVDASLDSLSPATDIAPVRIRVDRLSIDMRVTAEGLDAKGAMALPPNAADAGWYRYSPGLTATEGATVIAAHIDSRHDGIGPFSRLKNAVAGDTITLSGADGSEVAYTVTGLKQVGKIDAPMAEVFDTTGAPRLSLVTCGGVFDSSTGHYLDNVIVTAVPVASASTNK